MKVRLWFGQKVKEFDGVTKVEAEDDVGFATIYYPWSVYTSLNYRGHVSASLYADMVDISIIPWGFTDKGDYKILKRWSEIIEEIVGGGKDGRCETNEAD